MRSNTFSALSRHILAFGKEPLQVKNDVLVVPNSLFVDVQAVCKVKGSQASGRGSGCGTGRATRRGTECGTGRGLVLRSRSIPASKPVIGTPTHITRRGTGFGTRHSAGRGLILGSCLVLVPKPEMSTLTLIRNWT